MSDKNSAVIEQAIKCARDSVHSEGFSVADISKCIAFDAEEWDEDNDPDEDTRKLARKTLKSGQPQLGITRAWLNEN